MFCLKLKMWEMSKMQYGFINDGSYQTNLISFLDMITDVLDTGNVTDPSVWILVKHLLLCL